MAEEEAPARPPPPKPSIMRTVTIMMFLLTIFVMVDANLRNVFVLGASAVFGPLIGFGGAYPVITILLAGSLTTTVSSILRHFFTDWVKMTRMNKQLGAVRKAQMEAMRRGNPGKVQKLREVQFSVQKDAMDVQFAPMKSMAFTFLLFIIIFAWLSAFVYAEVVAAGHAYFAVPWQPSVDLRAGYVFPAWILLYSLLALPLSQVVTRLLKFLQFRKRLAALGAQAE